MTWRPVDIEPELAASLGSPKLRYVFALRLVLNSGHPMYIWWPQLRISRTAVRRD